MEKNILTLFLSLASGVVLFFLIGYAISIGFILINEFFPSDVLEWNTHSWDVLNSFPVNLSVILVLSPVLYFLLRKIRLMTEGDEISKGRYVISIFILIVSSALILVPGIILISSLLKGDLSLAFFFKLIFTAYIGLSVFYYFYSSIKLKYKYLKIFNINFVILFIILVSLSIITINPLTRLDTLDTYEKLDFLVDGRIISSIDSYYFQNKRQLPKNRDLSKLGGFEYKVTGSNTYTLCNTFNAYPRWKNLQDYPYEDFEITKLGEDCFNLVVPHT